jgi:isopentenyl phosphate kinase
LTDPIFVKLGGSIITEKQQAATPRLDVIRRLAREVHAALLECPGLNLVLGHGSGSFGHVVGKRYHVREGIEAEGDWWGYAATAAAASRLNRIVTDAFLREHVPVVVVQPSASARCWDGELIAMETHPIQEAMGHGLVPLVYGDVAFDEQRGCTIVSTEAVFAYLARRLHPERIVLVGKVDGVYDRDPLVYPSAHRIDRITPSTFAEVETKLGGSHGIDVTGGMLAKVCEMVALVAEGATPQVRLISGYRDDALMRAIVDADGADGTVISS